MSPFRGGEDAVSGDRTRGGDDAEALPLCDCRLAERLCCAYCSGSAGLGGMSPREFAEPSESEERIAPAAMSSTLGRRLRTVSKGDGSCSLLERDAVEEIELLAEPAERLPPFRDLRMDFRTLFLREPAAGGGAC